MKKSWLRLIGLSTIVTMLTGCDPLLVLDPKGPQAQVQAKDIMLSIGIMSFIVLIVFVLLAYMLVKFRASKQSPDYKPPHIKGSTKVEIICVGIPVLIVAYLSFISVESNYKVESTPEKYKQEEPLIIYASTSNWKWHFSYPEEDIETVNYLYIPAERPIEFKLYSYGPITSFWIPQLGGQKYAMADMVNTLHLAADLPGEYMGRNANFNGKGFAENTFNVTAVTQDEFDDWVKEVKATAEPLTEEKFNTLLEPGHVGQSTYTGTHLTFLPAPEGENGGHQHGTSHIKDHASQQNDH
ncbi:cytochrome aa3 quinol oxidase subunit II [Lysinibacillus capsici]|mgnify:CR=1|uniref:Quinol oxidase subunit 2 n=1 Tax=Lysinibacillus capsici TaxID=2115968 RepID=A0ABY8KJZ5_9BACI|nr:MULTISPECIES: cytochrome aa3 quinol oxidase subunit II [Lysinibacillus]AUS86858.1 cytochrome aa3 quinol oxidase subunit II [Lysinibacillus sp. YS11]MCM0623883.1 cytochrome aa3 quinol oxidase subunit II [Lysinibacillus sp. OL1_EC]MCR6522189.1 cytochrome aa3 quinol oxidase subunit II [Lysinibacillus capsici]MEC1303714.1 cytochrome aa3 quinol oxidase subunit II [Lysinibacillus capsici]MED3873477.1 cytochrome aa3 quinol oxidase subunit II [Lysinibacillus capsici]